MKIAVASQNRRAITEHAGRCRRFWIYTVDDDRILDKALLELDREEVFHGFPADQTHPLDAVDGLITGGMGPGLVRRLARRGVAACVTAIEEPDAAIQAWLEGRLTLSDHDQLAAAAAAQPGDHHAHDHGHHHDHEHGHGHGHGHGCGCQHGAGHSEGQGHRCARS